MKIVSCCIVAVLGLSACAGPKVNSGDAILIEQARSTAKATCVGARGEADAARYKAMSSLPKEQLALVFAMEAMSRQAEALSSKKDPCADGMGYFDYAADVARSQNDAIKNIAPLVVQSTVAGFGIWAANDTLKTAFKNSGNQTTTTITGDSNSAEHTHIQTTANTETTSSTGDGGGTISTANPPVTGPDQSTSTENTYETVTPEVPVEEVAE